MKEYKHFKKDKSYWRALALMIGYIVGVGMFGLPFITSRSGVFLFVFYLLFLGFIQYFVNLVYANMIIITEDYHRLPGYVNLYLGKAGKHLVFITKIFGYYGSLLAYIIISGSFLYQLLGDFLGGSPFIYASFVFLIESLIVFIGIKLISRVELYISALLFLVVFIIFFKSVSISSFSNFSFLNWKYFFLPYGVMLGALDGSSILPVVAKIVRRHPQKFKSVIRNSMIISMLITAIFVLSIVGISGKMTSEDALSGLKLSLNNGILRFALVFGFLSIMTSVLGAIESLRETFSWDYKVNKNIALLLTVIIPYLLYCFGFNDLISVIGLTGALAGGFSTIMLIFAFIKMRNKKHDLSLFKYAVSDKFFYLIILLFLSGIGYTLFSFLNN